MKSILSFILFAAVGISANPVDVLVVHDAGPSTHYYEPEDVGEALAFVEELGNFRLVLADGGEDARDYGCVVHVSVVGSCFGVSGSFRAKVELVKPEQTGLEAGLAAFGMSVFNGRSARYACLSEGRRSALENAADRYRHNLLQLLDRECGAK